VRGTGSSVTTRRAFLGTLAGGLLTAPLIAEAQPGTIRRIGSLGTGTLPTPAELAQSAFNQELTKLGWIEGKNLVVERRRANSAAELETLAAEMVRLNPEIIVVPSAGLAAIAQKATRTIPIVTTSAGELGSSGLVASLSRPGGNVTGMQLFSPELMGKRLQILREVVPNLSRMVVMTSGQNLPGISDMVTVYRQATDESARQLGVRVRYAAFRGLEGLGAFFDEATRERDRALLVFASPFVNPHGNAIAEQALRHRLPMMGELRHYQEGLLVYGPVLDDIYRAAAGYVDRILRGAKPSDLPIGQPTRFELVINLKTAKALGLTIPPSLLQRADEIIQ
jgi:putative ABC transport system substrate-binding protein